MKDTKTERAAPRDAGIEEVVVDRLPCWRLYSARGEVLVARQGAQLLRYTPSGQRPVVWLSDTARFAPGEPLRGGIPVCWPWFGQLERNPQAVRDMVAGQGETPAHGLVRTRDWYLAGFGAADGGALMRLRIDLPSGAGPWLHGAELTLEVRLDDGLSLNLSTRNTGATPMVISQALHTYFSVSDSREVHIEGLEGTRYVETLENWEMRTQQGPLAITGETDRIYTGVERPLAIRDPGWHRVIHLHATHSRSAVVWNPWVEKSRRLSQFAPDAWRDMLCIETARVWDDLLSIAPGGTGAMGVRIRSQTLRAPG